MWIEQRLPVATPGRPVPRARTRTRVKSSSKLPSSCCLYPFLVKMLKGCNGETTRILWSKTKIKVFRVRSKTMKVCNCVGGVGFPESFQSWWLKQASLWWDGVTIFQADQICHFRFPWFWGVLCPRGWRRSWCKACVSTNTQWVVAGLIHDLYTALHYTDLLGNLLLWIGSMQSSFPFEANLSLPFPSSFFSQSVRTTGSNGEPVNWSFQVKLLYLCYEVQWRS